VLSIAGGVVRLSQIHADMFLTGACGQISCVRLPASFPAASLPGYCLNAAGGFVWVGLGWFGGGIVWRAKTRFQALIYWSLAAFPDGFVWQNRVFFTQAPARLLLFFFTILAYGFGHGGFS